VGVLGALALGWWFAAAPLADETVIDPDRVVPVERRDLLDAVTASGRIEPLARVAVMSRASGIVKELFVEEGDRVERGQVLAELDREQLEVQLAQDEADLASAQARLAAARARVEEARVKLEDPELDFLTREVERLEALFQSGNVSVKDRDEASRALAAVRFRVDQARATLPVLEAAVAGAEADLASADHPQSDRRHRARAREGGG
jgi:HlyD family secretion protein